MQRTFNNKITFIEKLFNEVCYEFTSFQNTDLIQTFFKSNFSFICKNYSFNDFKQYCHDANDDEIII